MPSKSRRVASQRLLQTSGRLNVERVGLRYTPLLDLYHALLVTRWWSFLLWMFGVWLLINLGFALLYRLGGDCLVNARPGSLEDAFYFSVHTMATIGYGTIVPRTEYANLVVVIESFVGMLSQAVMTGLVFAKFSRPTARVLFSRQAVLTRRDQRDVLMFRMANGRANQVVQANLSVVYSYNDVTPEGESTRRLVDLTLTRSITPFFVLSWTAIHVVDETSPLWGLSLEQMREQDTEFFVIFSGIDETFSQAIHARYSYRPEDLVRGRFADIISVNERGQRRIDYRKFHEVLADPN